MTKRGAIIAAFAKKCGVSTAEAESTYGAFADAAVRLVSGESEYAGSDLVGLGDALQDAGELFDSVQPTQTLSVKL